MQPAQEMFRRRVVQAALRLTEGTPMAASTYEQQLLEQFVCGQLTIEEVIRLVDAAPPAPGWPPGPAPAGR
ncbi:MAG TPA: hypothetical protein VFO93_15835 [Hymenobacter sp.]|uniref:hypothetical protein n=1 Tax=Hymenobacter sp. TaxID=1898978 RepID=UPI002D7EB426|nr:hypothetical protein [Hymenobacter sp.]HET9505013.1 hypothetical protein [Hymenobacter sp.]